MARYAIMNEETTAMRKEHDVFNKDITKKLQKIHEKCSFFNQEANSGPEDTPPGVTEEDTEEVIVYRPPFQRPEMRVEMQRRQDLPNSTFAFNAPADGRPPLHFPPFKYRTGSEPINHRPNHSKPPKAIFQIPVPNVHDANGSELDHYKEREREWRSKEEAAKLDMKEEIRKAMKELQCIPEVTDLNYEDLCIHSNLDLPEGFKVPKFDVFGGTGNPLAHLRAYCGQLVGVGRDEALLMWLFSRSLSREALEWFTSHETRLWPSWNALTKDFIERFAYNVEIVPDRYSLEKMKQKSNESYREFVYRWRNEAARVRPPTFEKEIVEVFVRVQEPEYYDRIMLLIGAKFAEIVKIGETIEDGLRIGKIARVAALPGSSGLLKKKREDTPSYHYRNVTPNCANIQANYQAPPPTYQTPAPLYQNTLPNYQAPQPNYQTHSYPWYQAPRPNTPNYRQMPPPQQGNYDPSRPTFEKKPARIFTQLVESCTKLFERLNAAGYIHPVGPKPHKIQDLIDQKVVSLQTVELNINSNPLPNHGGVIINMIETDDDWCVMKAIVPIAHDNLERAVVSLSIKEKKEFVILTPKKVAALVPRETLARPKFVIETIIPVV
ncbi:hypothetical protein R3W88_008605 [Solanum pinnatisectum]|uniref:Retrotransposon gag domain-containing protein n=1 Tax=Solanum pinnatisectum TaxID=50273 RepID=A0AAV9MBN2_9SOLN|nr:hypothetical protein R3W88_008605 [Solanum pinnatisectum]